MKKALIIFGILALLVMGCTTQSNVDGQTTDVREGDANDGSTAETSYSCPDKTKVLEDELRALESSLSELNDNAEAKLNELKKANTDEERKSLVETIRDIRAEVRTSEAKIDALKAALTSVTCE
ncbi:MAG TPA: hypothetical protein VJC07_02085 [Candidatus Nanoarchaeia archaeon]|nr:hypothetical protein [Candidatus Nanoarchaeia archaeon]